MLIMHPLPHAFRSLKAALLMVNVPKVSMSNTAVSSVLIGLLLMHIVHLSPIVGQYATGQSSIYTDKDYVLTAAAAT